MGFLSGIVSGIESAVSAVSSFVSAAVETLGPQIKETVDKLGPALSMVPGKVGAIARVITFVSEILGIFQKGDSVEDIGDRAMQGAEQGITPEGYESFDEYMKALRNIELDPAKTEETSQVDKVLAGAGVSVRGFNEKVDESPEVLRDFYSLISSNPDFFNEERASRYASEFGTLAEVVDYFKGDLDAPEAVSVLNQLYDIEEQLGNDRETFREELQGVKT